MAIPSDQNFSIAATTVAFDGRWRATGPWSRRSQYRPNYNRKRWADISKTQIFN
ncbi:MAG: hypothetical protein LBF24_01415 [Puniceicoccales bacterium]|nr:hypothetical protein [Puniceicoccales bacterium]